MEGGSCTLCGRPLGVWFIYQQCDGHLDVIKPKKVPK